MKLDRLLEELATAITRLHRDHPRRIAVDGIDASGKTTLADALVAPLATRGQTVIRASIDGFHHPRDRRYRRGRWSAEGYYRDSFNYEGVVSGLLLPLGPEGDRRYRVRLFDYRTDTPVDPPLRRADPDAILVFDGVFLLRPELLPHWDFTIFVEVGFSVARERGVRRDRSSGEEIAALERAYTQRYLPGQEIYLRECRPRERVDALVHNDNWADPWLEWGDPS